MVLLSAVLIVRDEAARLPGCLASLDGVVDEIVVVDTGSLDGSVAIARRYGARTSAFAWRDDFAAARNAALERARGDWVLSIDADERLRPPADAGFAAALADPQAIGLYVLLQPQAGHTPYRDLRLFRRAPDIRFTGIIHENVWPALQRRLEQGGCRIGSSGLALDHLGYDGDQTRKHLRDLPLLRRALAEDPDHVYCWFHLGRVHAGQGEPAQADAAWRAGVAAVRRRGVRRASDSLVYLELIRAALAAGEEPGDLLAEAAARFPANAALHWLRGQSDLRAGRIADAIAAFERLRRWPEHRDLAIAYDRRLFGAGAHAALGTCHFRVGRFADAEREFAAAAALEPASLEHRLKQALCRDHRRRQAADRPPDPSRGPPSRAPQRSAARAAGPRST